MLAKIKTNISRLMTNGSDESSDARERYQTSVAEDEDTKYGSTVDSPPYLYECASCDRIYVSEEKDTCSHCDTAVTRVDQSD